MHPNEEIIKFLMWISYFINILDKKTIQNGILSIAFHLISLKNFYCCLLLKF